jgi:hypothetical protein
LGVFASNCANLAINLGFHGLFIEADAALVERGRAFYAQHPDTSLYPPMFAHAEVTPATVNDVVRWPDSPARSIFSRSTRRQRLLGVGSTHGRGAARGRDRDHPSLDVARASHPTPTIPCTCLGSQAISSAHRSAAMTALAARRARLVGKSVRLQPVLRLGRSPPALPAIRPMTCSGTRVRGLASSRSASSPGSRF